MTENPISTDRMRAILVLVATIGVIAFNFLAAAGRINNVSPAQVSDKYPTLVTPADYAFSIWSLIYAGLIAFSIYQLLPSNLVKFRGLRTFYILSCALNCGWIYFWLNDQIAVCFVLIFLLAASLFMINLYLRTTETPSEYWLAKAPFGIYFGWVTAATLVNFAILLVYWNVRLSPSAWNALAVGLILLAAVLGVLIRICLRNYLYPLAIAWALTAIAVKQSGQTPIVVAAAVGVIACLIATLSFVLTLPSSADRRT